MSSRNISDGLTQIGEFTICTDGRAANHNGQRYRVHRDEIEEAKAVLGGCRRTRWARRDVSPSAEQLSQLIVGDDDGAHFSVSMGAIIIAASELGIVWVPLGVSDALIGVNIDDVRQRTNTSTPALAREQEGRCTEIEFLTATTEPPPQEWAIQDCILKKQVTTLYGEGGVGKSMLSLQLAASTVLGRDWFGYKPEPGPVIYLGAEDDEDELQRRLCCIASQLGEPMSELIENGLHASSYAGKNMALSDFAGDVYVENYTPLYAELFERAQIIRPVMIILDTLSDIFDGDENNRAQVTEFVGLLRQLAVTANCAVIVNAHPSQSGSSSGTSGSTAWHGKVRGRLHLRAATKDEGGADPDLRVLEFKKLQYGRLPPKIMMHIQDNGLFVPALVGCSTDPEIAGQRADDVFMALLDRFTPGRP